MPGYIASSLGQSELHDEWNISFTRSYRVLGLFFLSVVLKPDLLRFYSTVSYFDPYEQKNVQSSSAFFMVIYVKVCSLFYFMFSDSGSILYSLLAKRMTHRMEKQPVWMRILNEKISPLAYSSRTWASLSFWKTRCFRLGTFQQGSLRVKMTANKRANGLSRIAMTRLQQPHAGFYCCTYHHMFRFPTEVHFPPRS